MIRQSSIIFLLLSILIITHWDMSLECADIQHHDRNLVMVFDISKSETPAKDASLLGTALPALIQKTAPIIMSPSTWNNYTQRKKRFAATPLKEQLSIDLEQTLEKIRESGQVADFDCYATPFDPKEWIIKKLKVSLIFWYLYRIYRLSKKASNQY